MGKGDRLTSLGWSREALSSDEGCFLSIDALTLSWLGSTSTETDVKTSRPTNHQISPFEEHMQEPIGPPGGLICSTKGFKRALEAFTVAT